MKKLIKRPYVKIYHPRLCDGWYGSYDCSCVTSRWDCLPEEDKPNMKIELWDDTRFVGYISEESMENIASTQHKGTFDNFEIEVQEPLCPYCWKLYSGISGKTIINFSVACTDNCRERFGGKE